MKLSYNVASYHIEKVQTYNFPENRPSPYYIVFLDFFSDNSTSPVPVPSLSLSPSRSFSYAVLLITLTLTVNFNLSTRKA